LLSLEAYPELEFPERTLRQERKSQSCTESALGRKLRAVTRAAEGDPLSGTPHGVWSGLTGPVVLL
jgi:hypothetical protein